MWKIWIVQGSSTKNKIRVGNVWECQNEVFEEEEKDNIYLLMAGELKSLLWIQVAI